MKGFRIFLPIFTVFLFAACSKHYQGDLDVFSLTGRWEVAFSAKAGTELEREETLRWGTVELPGRVAIPDTAQALWLRRQFVLPGHFPDRQIYLYLGKVGSNSRVLLNGHSLICETRPLWYFLNLYGGELLLEVHPDELHYGKTNRLMLVMDANALPDTLLAGHPGLYTRLGFLNMKGQAVQECDFSLERDLHARLEDLAESWQKGDSLGLVGYFSDLSLKENPSTRMLLKDMLRVQKIFQPVDIELSRPEFFRCPVQGKILVLGEWLFHRTDGSVERIPFQWAIGKENAMWKLQEVVRIGEKGKKGNMGN